MIIESFIKKYLNEDNVERIIFHSGSIIIKDVIKTIIAIFLLYMLFYVINIFITSDLLSRIFGILGIVFLIKFGITAFDKLIDCIVLTPKGITFFARDGVFKYKTDFFGRNTIEAISHTQSSFKDKLFAKGNIKIILQNEIIFDFEDVPYPKKQVQTIIKSKDKYKKNQETEEKKHKDDDNIGILSEAISDIIKEYLEKKDQL